MRNKVSGGIVTCSPLFLLLCVFSIVSENIMILLLYLGALLLHETAHLIMAKMLGCEISEIKLLPYGCRMSIVSIDSPWDELMIALSGPVCSLICFMGCRLIPAAAGFAKANMYIAMINLLPAYPLDGGRAINALLTMTGITLPRTLRAVMTFALAGIAGIWGYITKNVTLIIFAVFLLSEGISSIRQQEMVALSHMKNMRCAAVGRGISVRHIALRRDVNIGTALSYGFGGYSVFCILDDNMREIARVDGVKLAELAAEYGIGSSLGDIIPFIDRSKY